MIIFQQKGKYIIFIFYLTSSQTLIYISLNRIILAKTSFHTSVKNVGNIS